MPSQLRWKNPSIIKRERFKRKRALEKIVDWGGREGGKKQRPIHRRGSTNICWKEIALRKLERCPAGQARLHMKKEIPSRQLLVPRVPIPHSPTLWCARLPLDFSLGLFPGSRIPRPSGCAPRRVPRVNLPPRNTSPRDWAKALGPTLLGKESLQDRRFISTPALEPGPGEKCPPLGLGTAGDGREA